MRVRENNHFLDNTFLNIQPKETTEENTYTSLTITALISTNASIVSLKTFNKSKYCIQQYLTNNLASTLDQITKNCNIVEKFVVNFTNAATKPILTMVQHGHT